jgi:hypothetical protein
MASVNFVGGSDFASEGRANVNVTPESKTEISHSTYEVPRELPPSIANEKDPTKQVELAFAFVRSTLGKIFGLGPINETEREFCERIVTKAPGLKILLTRLMEISEKLHYGYLTTDETTCHEGLEISIKIIQQVARDQAWQLENH